MHERGQWTGKRRSSDKGEAWILLAALAADRTGYAKHVVPAQIPLSVVNVAESHGLPGALALYLRELPDVPEALAAEAEKARQAALAHHLKIVSSIQLVSEVMEEAGVPWAVAKGPVLSGHVYPRPDIRSYGDLDILVHPRGFGKTLSSLEERGAQLVDRNWAMIRSMHRGELSLLLPGGTPLDLHWHLLTEEPIREAFNLDVNSMLERTEAVDIGHMSVPTLEPTDTILHLMLHGALSGAHRLVWFEDLRQSFHHRPPDLAALVERATQSGSLTLVQAMLHRLGRLLGEVPVLDVRARSRSIWGIGIRLSDALTDRESLIAGRRTGRSLYASTRSTSLGSFSALLVELLRQIEASGIARRSGLKSALGTPPSPEELHRPGGSEEDRQGFLSDVERRG